VSITHQKFMNFTTGEGGGGAIDFIMKTQDVDFKAASRMLSSVSDDHGLVVSAVSQYAVAQVSDEINAKSVPLVKPKVEPSLEPKLKTWLQEVRKIPEKIVSDWMKKGHVYATKFRSGWQAVFKQNDNAFLRVNPETGFRGYVKGSELSEPLILGDSNNVAVVEGHVDAMSFQALHPTFSVCVSNGTSGVGKAVSKLKSQGKKVTLALDNDDAGKKVVDDIRSKPLGDDVEIMFAQNGKDWNDELIYQQQAELNQIQHEQEMRNDVAVDNAPDFK